MKHYTITWDNGIVEDFKVEADFNGRINALDVVKAYVQLVIDTNYSSSAESADIREVRPVEATVTKKVNPTGNSFPQSTSIFDRVPPTAQQPKVLPKKDQILLKVPKTDHLVTDDSTWIRSVDWFTTRYGRNGLSVNFRNGTHVEYELDYDTFSAFREWVGMGGSAGRFYNANIKGKKLFF